MKDLYIVHRGKCNDKYPENSIPAFNETINHKMPIELDIHILKDNTIVVFHDKNLKRMCNVDIDINKLDYDELLKYKLNETNYIVPTLKNVLDLTEGKVLLDIELKSDDNTHDLENEIINILKDYHGEFLLKSFDPRKVKYLKKLRKKYNMDFKVGLLIKDSKCIIPSFIYSNPDFVSFNFKNLNKKFFRFISHIKPTLLYTIKNKNELNSIKNYNGGYIIENCEEVLTK